MNPKWAPRLAAGYLVYATIVISISVSSRAQPAYPTLPASNGEANVLLHDDNGELYWGPPPTPPAHSFSCMSLVDIDTEATIVGHAFVTADPMGNVTIDGDLSAQEALERVVCSVLVKP